MGNALGFALSCEPAVVAVTPATIALLIQDNDVG